MEDQDSQTVGVKFGGGGADKTGMEHKNANEKLAAARDEMIAKFGVSKADAELMLMIAGAVAVKVAEDFDVDLDGRLNLSRAELKAELHRILGR